MSKEIKNMLREVAEDYKIENNVDETVYHNTLLLLKKYSKVKWRVIDSLEELEQESIELTDKTLTDLIDNLVGIDPRVKEERLVARLESIEQSKSILDFIDQSLIKLKQYPYDGEVYYEMINRAYINKTNKPLEAMAEEFGMSRATFFREKKKAINMFGIIMWGYIFHEIRT